MQKKYVYGGNIQRTKISAETATTNVDSGIATDKTV